MADPWMKLYTSDWLAGTRQLTPAETGIYITLICMMYEKGEPLRSDRTKLARLCNCPPGAFGTIIESLVEDGKLVIVDGGLWNKRVEIEISNRVQRTKSATHATNAKHSVQAGKSEQKQRLRENHAPFAHCESGATRAGVRSQKPDAREEKQKPSVSSKRGARLPEGWKPSERNLADASGMGMSSEAISTEADKFRDYWIAKPGAGGVKLDWDATWRNWCRNAASRQTGKRPPASAQSLKELFADELGDGEGRGSNVVAFGGWA